MKRRTVNGLGWLVCVSLGAVSLGATASFDALAQRVAPKKFLPPVFKVEPLAPETKRVPKPLQAKTFEVKDATGKHVFSVSVQASGYIDQRLLDYLAGALRVLPVDPKSKSAQQLGSAAGQAGKPDPTSDELALSLRAVSAGTQLAGFWWSWPAGFKLVRTGVIRVERELRDLVLKSPGVRFIPGAPVVMRLRSNPTGAFTTLKGTLKCEAPNTVDTQNLTRVAPVVSPLGFLKVKIGDVPATTNANGELQVPPGRYGAGTYELELQWDSTVTTGSLSSGLQVVDEVLNPRSETVTRVSGTSSGTTVDLGTITVSSVDCELWRLGVKVLDTYHSSNHRTPPAGRLRMKRWSNIHFGTPYTFYDYIVLATNFTTQDAYTNEWWRRATIFHEFGHSVRHVADGGEAHWHWDNFRWAYARNHSGCEIYNVQEAFNEGWAGYWHLANMPTEAKGMCAGRACTDATCVSDPNLDWNEDLIAQRLNVLGGASSRDLMVQVLERNPGEIHSMREFEVKYCLLAAAGNPHCRADRTPVRPAPRACPPDFHDDGATCRLDNIRAKPSYGRGVGVIPKNCGAGKEYDAGLCYQTCRAGFGGVGPVCWQHCPNGMRDDGAFCAKPAPYGRGGGYPWQFGDTPFSLDGARNRCVRDHGQCEQNGLLYYPKCRAGFHAVGCCICSPDCPAGMPDIGVSCAKQSSGRGVGTVPTSCQGGMQYDAGLCYTPCRSGYSGVGPVCWGKCDAGYADHGATCYKDPNVLVKY